MLKSVDLLVLRYGYVYTDHVIRLWYRWKLFCLLLFLYVDYIVYIIEMALFRISLFFSYLRTRRL